MTMPLPMRIEEVTAAWLQDCLSPHWPGLSIQSVTCDQLIHGAATKARLLIDYDWTGAGEPPPSSMWLKTGFEAHHEMCMPYYILEVDFYKNVLPLIPVRSPLSYFSNVQVDPPQATLLLEDLLTKNAVFGSALKPMTVEQVASGLEQLALLHSQELNETMLAELQPVSAARETVENFADDAERLFSMPRAYAAPVALHAASQLRTALDVYWRMIYNKEPCLLHGDSHVGNTYIEADNSVCFLDWQGYGTGYWMHDIPYFIIGALDLSERRHSESDLLKYYVSERVNLGAAMPAFDEIWDDYRRAVFHGFIMWLGNQDVWQTPEVNLAQYARFAAAMVDHRSYAALGV